MLNVARRRLGEGQMSAYQTVVVATDGSESSVRRAFCCGVKATRTPLKTPS